MDQIKGLRSPKEDEALQQLVECHDPTIQFANDIVLINETREEVMLSSNLNQKHCK